MPKQHEQHETTITPHVAEMLRKMCPGWKIEQASPFEGSQATPDIMAKRAGHQTIAIEAKPYHKTREGVSQVRNRYIGRELTTKWVGVSETLHTAMVIRYPKGVMESSGENLVRALKAAHDIEYLLIGETRGKPYQFPHEGYARGTLVDIANALQVGAVPQEEIDDAVARMDRDIKVAATWLEHAISESDAMCDVLEEILDQRVKIPVDAESQSKAMGDMLEETPELKVSEQTCRMACLIITNAFVFQNAIAGKKVEHEKKKEKDEPHKKDLRLVNPLSHYEGRAMNWREVVEDWETILAVNYQPIFKDALRMLRKAFIYDVAMMNKVLDKLWHAAYMLVQSHLPQIHELAGEIIQLLIIDRKYVKTNYTLPTSAALLSALVCPDINVNNLPKVADFACGTGALLNGVYKRVQRLYEQKTGRSSVEIHRDMLENNLAGSDIYSHNTHITFATMASAHPKVTLGATRVITAPYGEMKTADGNTLYTTGSLELLNTEEFEITELAAEQLHGDSEESPVIMNRRYPDGEMDIVLQNPPFSRDGADNNSPKARKGVFVSHQHSKHDKEKMKAALARKDTRVTHGQAGLGSYFADLADRKLKKGGVMGIILPISCLTGVSWQKLRNLWATQYHNVTIVTIAEDDKSDSAFSADTGMAECIVVATKGVTENTGRGRFVCLDYRPKSNLEASIIGEYLHTLQKPSQAEDIPHGGTRLTIGEQQIAQVIECPIPQDEVWSAARTKSMATLQTAHHLRNGQIWLPLQLAPIEIPMARVGEIAQTGFHAEVIQGKKGPFSITKSRTASDSLYPFISGANYIEQRTMVIEPDAEGTVRPENRSELGKVMSVNSHAHYYMLPTFSATSQLAMLTKHPSIGASAVTNIKFENTQHEAPFAVWCNSTLGLLCHWMHSAKDQTSRGKIKLNALKMLPTLDIRQLSEHQLAAAERIFVDVANRRMKPLRECDKDPWRHVLDARLLAEVLGITDDETHKSLHALRKTLSQEPSIKGTVKRQCNLAKERQQLREKGIELPGSEADDAAALKAQQQHLIREDIYLPVVNEKESTLRFDEQQPKTLREQMDFIA